MAAAIVMHTDYAGTPVRRGKVRDIYDFGDRMLIVSTDRISAFDYILPNGIPDKGRVLTQLSQYWFDRIRQRHHVITSDVDQMDLPPSFPLDDLRGRSMLVWKADVIPVECVVRGYLAGSGWKEYRQLGTVCEIPLPAGLRESSLLPQPIFTPATKAQDGHDENISPRRMADCVGQELADRLGRQSIEIYEQCAAEARQRGIIIADTKFEWGWIDGQLVIVDEVLTPDSSRFWPLDQYEPGRPQSSFDKQFVRDWLESTDWDKNSPPPPLPDEVVTRTRAKYIEAYERLTGRTFLS